MTVPVRRDRTDLGRLIMVPIAVVMLALDMVSLAHHQSGGLLHWLGVGLVCAFYTLMVSCYLRRGPAVATSRSASAHLAAVVASYLPFVFPLLPAVSAVAGRQLAGDALLVAGTCWSVWSLRFLGRNLSVIAQARDVVDGGPYRWVRHPLYTGEIVSSLGLAVTVGSAPAIGVWLLLGMLQAYRAVREEQVLVRSLPGYGDYRKRTAALLPGIV